MTEFQVGDIVDWCGALGTVMGMDEFGSVEVLFTKDSGREVLAQFTSDGKTHGWHKEPSLKLLERPKKKIKKTMYQAVMFLAEVGFERYEVTKEMFTSLDEAREFCSSNYRMHYEVIALGPAITFEVDDES